MFILKDCEKISIVTTQEALLENKENLQILFNHKIYDPVTFKCISDPTQRKLHQNMKNEYAENYKEALNKFHQVASVFSKKEVEPAVTPSENGTVVLKKYNEISIVTTEKDLIENTERISILFRDELFDPITFTSLEGKTQKKLGKEVRDEYKKNVDEIFETFTRLATTTYAGKTQQAPAVFQQQVPQAAPNGTGMLGAKLEEIMLKVLAEQSVDKVLDLAKPMLEDHIVKTFGVIPQVHEVKTPMGTHEIQGVVHEKFDQVLNLVSLDIPVYLSGEAGTGKNVICKQVAESFGLEFYFTNAVTQEYQLKGFTDANGRYHETQFYKAFTEGGLFFLDEMDASIPEALIILNSAIANRYFDFPAPIGKVEAHKNFRIISAGNTVGTGADIEYTGRFQLDASSLDRFALLEIDYSPAIEEGVTNKNTELCEFARKFRKVTKASGIRCLFTYRSLERISKMEQIFELPEVLKMSLTKGLGKDDLRIITKKFDESGLDNKYTKALKKVKVD